MERTGDGSITEGIGQGRVTDNLAKSIDLVDGAVHIPDSESIEMVFRLLDEEGLFVGASSALNVVAATKVAILIQKQQLKSSTSPTPRIKVVTIICDGAGRYASRLLSKQWLESKKFQLSPHLQRYITRA